MRTHIPVVGELNDEGVRGCGLSSSGFDDDDDDDVGLKMGKVSLLLTQHTSGLFILLSTSLLVYRTGAQLEQSMPFTLIKTYISPYSELAKVLSSM